MRFIICFIVVTLIMKESAASFCPPLVIAHRGASGYAPEHTLGAYALAITMGADFVEPDLVMTKDGHLIARHENELSKTTDVADRHEYADRRTIKIIDGRPITGWFSEDFTLLEIKTLRSIESNPSARPGNVRMDKAFEVPTIEEIIKLVKGMEVTERRTIGLYPEIKYSTYFKQLGLPIEEILVAILHRNGYHGRNAPVFIQSFEVTNLQELKHITDIPLVQLISGNQLSRPFDQVVLGTSLTYGQMATAEGLLDISKYASGVGPDKRLIIPRTKTNELGTATTFVKDAHAAGLVVHPYTFRSENIYLPEEFRSNDSSQEAIGNLEGKLEVFLEAGIDGLFVDQPDIPLRLKRICKK